MCRVEVHGVGACVANVLRAIVARHHHLGTLVEGVLAEHQVAVVRGQAGRLLQLNLIEQNEKFLVF